MVRPTVTVLNHENQEVIKEVRLPSVFATPIRNDIVHFVHYNLARNSQQAHGVDPRAGMKHSAESWGTGRAVARVPRVGGSGTSRNGQGAFANSCRKGRMAFPLKTWRRWHRKVNLRQRRHALASAIAATSVPALVMARGHRISQVSQFPLVLGDAVGQISKTKDAVAVLKKFNIYQDVERCIDAKKVRAGNGQLRNRKYKLRRGPLFVVNDESDLFVRALRNIPGVSTLNVNQLNISHLAPGGQVGRFVVYTASALAALEKQFGSFKAPGSVRKNYLLHRTVLSSSDISGLINSDAIQRVLRAKKTTKKIHDIQKKNPLRNKAMMKKLNPFASILKEQKKTLKKIVKVKATRKAFTKKGGLMITKTLESIGDLQEKQVDEYKDLVRRTTVQ